MSKASKRNQNWNIYCLYSPSTNKMSSYFFFVATICWRYSGKLLAHENEVPKISKVKLTAKLANGSDERDST